MNPHFRTAVVVVLAVLVSALLCTPARADERHRTINEKTPGEPVDITKFIVNGKTNIFDFYSKYCPPCVRISPLLDQLAEKNPDVVVNKIDINRPDVQGIDWQGPCARQYDLHSIPHFIIYDASGAKIAEGKEARTRVLELLKKAGLMN